MNSIEIVSYRPEWKKAFKDLNVEWISRYFVMEPPDYKALDYPEEYILDKGGNIFVALSQDHPVGVCAMVKMNDPVYQYELAKMAVSPLFQGKKIGFSLGNACLDWARDQGAIKVYLESNRILEPAIQLYKKLGFIEVYKRKSPYARADILMECTL